MGKYLDLLKDEATTLLRNKKNLVNVLLLGILILGLWLGVDLARREQIIKSRATNPPIVFTGNNVQQRTNEWVVLDVGKPITLELTAPVFEGGGSFSKGLVGTVRAEDCTPGDYKTDCTTQCGGCAADAGEAKVFQCNADGSAFEETGSQQCETKCAGACGNTSTCNDGDIQYRCLSNACPADPSVGVGIPQVCQNNKWVDKPSQGECTDKCTAAVATGCPAGQTQVSAEVAQKMRDGNYLVDYTIVNEKLQSYEAPWSESNKCGYKYHVFQSLIKDGGACVTYNFGPWDDQKQCPGAGQCTVKWTLSESNPAPNKDITVTVKGEAGGNGWTNVHLVLDGKQDGVKWVKGEGTTYTYTVNSGAVGNHKLTFTSNDNKLTCTPPQEFTTGGGSCSADSSLTITPSTAKVGETMVFQYPADGKRELNVGGDTWSAGIDSTKCQHDIGNRKYTCTATSAGTGTWNHYWNQKANCGSATYTITGGSSTTATPTHFRVAESPAEFSETGVHGWQKYTADGMRVDFTFTDKTPGQKSVFVEFKYTNDRTQRRNAQIRILGPDPAITGCSLGFEGNNTILNIKGSNFGLSKGLAKSNDTTLTIRQWNNDSIQAVFQNAPVGEELPIAVTNSDNQTGSGRCSAISQLSLGAKVFCRAPSSHDTDNVDMVLAEAFAGGKKIKQKVKIDKEGIIQGLSQRLESGKRYKIALKGPKSVRKTVEFTAGDGTTNIPNFVLPVGDIFPADGGDGAINSLDKLELNRQFILTQAATGRSGDFNKDTRVNSIDWACMRNGFGSTDDAEPDPGGPVVTVSPSPSPSPSASIAPSSNLLRSDMQNAHYTVNSGANFQVWFDAGAYRLSGTVNATAVAQRTPLATITADEWDLTTTPPTFIRTYDNNTDFTVPAGHKMGVVLRVVDADATFSNVSLTSTTTPGNLLRSDMQNAHYTVNSGANFQVWFDAGAYRLSGTVNATAVAQRTPLATITADEWDLTTTPPTFIRTYDNNTDFTVPAGHKMGVVLRVVDADATFSNVSLIKK